MTHGTPSVLVVLRTGALLSLLGCVAIAQLTPAPSDPPTGRSDTTILARVSSVHQSQQSTSSDGREVNATGWRTRDAEQDGKQDESDASSHETRSSDESTVDGRRPRHGESSGKSTSTKTEESGGVRFSRTNELTALNDSKQDPSRRPLANATLEDPREETSAPSNVSESAPARENKYSRTVDEGSGAKSEQRRNETVVWTKDEAMVDGNSSPSTRKSDAKLEKDEKKEKLTKADYGEFSKLESRKTDDASGRKAEDRDREATTARGDWPKRAASDHVAATASEALDLEKSDEAGHEGTVSLVNDTYVNYNGRFHKTSKTEKNRTADASGSKGDPKAEVEIVKHVTHVPTLKIIANDTATNDSRSNHVEEERKIGTLAERHQPREGDDGRIGEAESQVKVPETITTSVTATASPVPQGRTIGFSAMNEFPSVEAKSEAAKVSGVAEAARTNGSKVERLDQKPYPYVKSNREAFQATTTVASEKGVTEETSAYENTIGRGESERKFVVTELSVVIDNSIQAEQKPSEKGANESTSSTTTESPPRSAASASVISAEATNASVSALRAIPNAAAMTAASNENVVADAKGQQEKATGRRDEGYDVTGNGITEVSRTADGEVKSDQRRLQSSTPRAASTNADVQMDPEEAMMMRSTLDVTEATVVPPARGATVGANESTSLTEVSTEAMVVENFTDSTPRANVTLGPSSSADQNGELASSTLNPDESSVPTTTSIEFEFVGLTESSLPSSTLSGNATERGMERRTLEEQQTARTIATSVGSSTMSDSTVSTIKPEESTELPATTEDGTPTTNQVSIGDNETTEGIVRDPSVTQIAPDDRSDRMGQSASNEIATTPIGDLMSAATEVPSAATEGPSKDANAVTMPPTTNVSGSPPSSTSISPSTLEPRVLWSTPVFTESPDEEATDSIQLPMPEEITLVKIVIEGTVHEVCPRLPDLKKALAEVLTNGMDKLVLPKQIIIHQSPCRESVNSSPTPMEMPLTSILIYVVDEDGKFDVVMTKILPSLYKVSPNFPVRIHKFLLVPEADSGNAIAVVVVSSVAFICLLLLAGLLFIMRKRQTRFNYGERCRPVSLDAYSLDSVSAYNSVRRKGTARASKRSYGNPTFEDSSAIPSHPLNFAGLSSFCNDVNAINDEFTGIPQISAKIDELPPGAELKNRYANVIPLPETRVPLQRLNNDASTEYINASYVRGPKNATKYYIACQAPMESTVTDFWRMIWEQQCKVIIMLTDLVENGVEKCTEYIPPSEVTDCHRLYGDFQVTLKKRETKEKYAISTLHLKNLENNTFREVFHIWYLWPVSGVQSDGTGLIAVLLEARAFQRGGPGPIVVHCSPGTGRTGTLIALDLGIRQYEITRTVDVPRVVYTIRRDRAGAVQTKEQYAFIYKALNLYATKLAGGVLEST